MNSALDRRLLALLLLGVALLGLVLALVLSLQLELPRDDFILYQLRLPRAIMAILAGSVLATAGAAYQVLFQNALATPSTVGTTAGATLGAMFALIFELEGFWALSGAALFAFALAWLASSIIIALAYVRRLEEVLLGGIAISLAAAAISQALTSIAKQDALFGVAQWALGYLGQVGYEKVQFLLLPWAASLALLLSQSRNLSVFSLGQQWAQTAGVNIRRTQVIVLAAGSLGVGAVVALVGPIAFVGLLVPHLLRAIGVQRPQALLPASALYGALFLLAADFIAQVILPGRELPVGVLTSALGAPALFLALLRKQKV